MKETSKAMKRRFGSNDFPWDDVFEGIGLDVGAGDDPMGTQGAIPFDLPDGAGDNTARFFPGAQFDFIHGSQVLEHAHDPAVMLRSWLSMLKPGGYIVATVPDWTLYEKRIWPSRWNAGHRSTWSFNTDGNSPAPIHCSLPHWFGRFECEVVLCKLISTNYDYNAPPTLDQTFDANAGVECSIEFVLRKPQLDKLWDDTQELMQLVRDGLLVAKTDVFGHLDPANRKRILSVWDRITGMARGKRRKGRK